jgi:acyl dehydratase
MEQRQKLYLEEFYVGQRFVSGEYEITADAIRRFATEFDPQDFHLDQSVAEASVFQGLAASGWHTAAVTMRLQVTGGFPIATGLIGLGGEIAWPRPTRAGDILHVETEILEIRPSKTKPMQGIVTARTVTKNQRGEEVQVFTAKIMAYRKGSP